MKGMIKQGLYGSVQQEKDQGITFVEVKPGDYVFIHFRDVVPVEAFDELKNGDVVEFDVIEAPKGRKAVNVRRVVT